MWAVFGSTLIVELKRIRVPFGVESALFAYSAAKRFLRMKLTRQSFLELYPSR